MMHGKTTMRRMTMIRTSSSLILDHILRTTLVSSNYQEGDQGAVVDQVGRQDNVSAQDWQREGEEDAVRVLLRGVMFAAIWRVSADAKEAGIEAFADRFHAFLAVLAILGDLKKFQKTFSFSVLISICGYLD